ncbi:MAG: outer membrane protein assembly factor BamE, partial [Magnetococcales bacterium]|nr:outer membrane protein assembly factor BamE [Magnetococcales bacterium]
MPATPFFIHVFLIALSLFLTACQAVISESGNIIEPAKVDQIQAGVSNRDEVLRLLGPPTLVNSFRQERWIYIQDRKFKNMQRTFSRVANRLEITFDDNGMVKDIKRNFNETLYDPREVAKPSDEKSYTKWLFGGEFSKPSTDPRPEEVKKESTGSGSFLPTFLTGNGPTTSTDGKHKSKPEESAPLAKDPGRQYGESTPPSLTDTTEKKETIQGHADPEDQSSWSLWPMEKKIQTSLSVPKMETDNKGTLTLDTPGQDPANVDTHHPDLPKTGSGLAEDIPPRTVLQPPSGSDHINSPETP